MHRLAPLRGRRLLVDHAWLLAAATDDELAAAAALHQAQADQLRDRELVDAFRRTFATLAPLRFGAGAQAVSLAELLALAPPAIAEQIRSELAAVELDVDARWP